MSGPTVLLRNEPVQARSTARLTSLLDAAAAAIDHVGFERLTTAMVAERAGASIGTVYRYFPDRIAVLQSVAARAVDRFSDRVRTTLGSRQYGTWWDAIEALIDEGVDAFAKEPAFAALRFGDVLDLRPRENTRTGSSEVSDVLAPVLVSRYGFKDDADLPFRLEVVFQLVDSLLARAFAFDARGDKQFIREAKRVAHSYLVSVYGEPTPAV
ncbi:TetR/AcrR family transcriptional regulator [Leifsonia bigeumensis]|uniref:TetR/AcrR family transcriptional regulator n=1 Tax=Leifsonella bigeumensis TaxID=433643 RepID=A0ABP7FKN5_9MICO